MNRRRHPRWADALLVALGVGAGLAAVELGLRVLRRPSPVLFVGRGYLKPDREADFDIQEDYPRTRRVSLDPRHDYWLWSNELGCYDDPFLPRGREPYVLLVGDSFIQGGFGLEDTWGARLQAECGRRVLKCGVAGYGTRQELLKTRKLTARAGTPGLIVVGHYVNDVDDDFLLPARTVIDGWLIQRKRITDDQTGACAVKTDEMIRQELALRDQTGEVVECTAETPFQSVKCWLDRHSLLYHRLKPPLRQLLLRTPLLSRLLARSQALAPESRLIAELPQELPWVQRAWKTHFDSLKAFQALAKERRAKLLVVLIPLRNQVYPHIEDVSSAPERLANLERARRGLARFLAREGIDFLDLLEPFREHADPAPRRKLDSERDLYMEQDVHWSRAGHRLAGLLVAQRILASRLLESPDRRQRLAAVEKELAELRKGR